MYRMGLCWLLLMPQLLQANSSLKLVKSIAEQAEQIQSIWPGFAAQFNHAIYTPKGDIYLLSNETELSGWEAREHIGQLTVWYKNMPSLKQYKRTFFLGETLAPGVVVDAVVNENQPIITLFHESFHEFQKQTPAEKVVTDWSGATIDTSMIKIKQAEFTLLKRMLEMTDQQQLKQQIVLYVSLRAYREQLMDSSNLTLERNMEWQEGVATYVGLRVHEVINQQAFVPALTSYGEKLNQMAQSQELEKFMRFDAYFHGAAVSYLVSQFMPDWQQRINQGASPFALLVALFPPQKLTQQEVESSLNISDKNEVIAGEHFAPLREWKKTLFIDGEPLVAGFSSFRSQKMESKLNGHLVHDVSKIHINNDYFELSARARQMFFSEGQVFFKLSSLPQKLKKCLQLDEERFTCQAGAQIKFGSIKLKLKQDMTFFKKQQLWLLKLE